MKVDEYDGKTFLATVRGGDFAHAGEIEAIDLTFSRLKPQPDWNVLDVGCGLGGTAKYVNDRGWGNVVGIDIDKTAIAYATAKYAGTGVGRVSTGGERAEQGASTESDGNQSLAFHVGAMEEVGARFPAHFDLLYSFNVFYASKEKQRAMQSFRDATKTGGILCIFDYVMNKPEGKLPDVFLGQTPATPDEFSEFTRSANWEVFHNENLDAKYIEWYQNFIAKFDDPAVNSKYSAETVANVRGRYAELLESVENGILGGLLLLARAK